MVYSTDTKKGKMYLHRKGSLFWFRSKIDKRYAVDNLPEGYSVGTNKRTGMPYVYKS